MVAHAVAALRQLLPFAPPGATNHGPAALADGAAATPPAPSAVAATRAVRMRRRDGRRWAGRADIAILYSAGEGRTGPRLNEPGVAPVTLSPQRTRPPGAAPSPAGRRR